MTAPDVWTVLAGVTATGFAAAMLLLGIAVRGTVPDPLRAPGRLHRAAAQLRSKSVGVRSAAAVGAAAAVLLFTGWPVAAAGAAALVLCWPRLFGGAAAERTQIARLDALVSWTESMRDTMAAHASLEQAIPATAANTSPLIRPQLTRLVGLIRAKVPVDQALRSLAADLDDPSADIIIAALILNVRRRGAHLRDVLSGLTTAAREELDLRRKVLAGRAEIRRGAAIVAVFSAAVAAFMVLFAPDFVAPYATTTGQVVLVVVAGIFAAGFTWMRRLATGEAAQPYLARPDSRLPDADAQLLVSLTGGGGER